jgi:glycosidase
VILKLSFIAVFVFFAAIELGAESASHNLWQTQSIYQIVTDRFCDGDDSNNNADGNYDPAGHRGTSVHGGDFKGIEKKLDYIQALGATAIWISPVILNARGEFHGYAGLDFYKVDPHWGSLADLRHMVDEAHARRMLVIDDVVVNHGGDLIDSGDAGYPKFKYPPAGYDLRFRDLARQYPPPFDLNPTNPALTNLFHNNGVIQNYDDPIQRELGELSGLDDFRTESPFIRAQMAKIYEYWIDQVRFDGFRIDTVQHVEMGFWQTWCPAIHSFAAVRGKPDFFMFGEVLNSSDAKCGSYTGKIGGGPFKLDSVLDYPLYFKINSVFARADGNTKQLADRYAAISASYDPSARAQLVTFLDNHDQPRFLSSGLAHDDTNRLAMALGFLYTARGVPCLYYGTEQGFDGGRDPYDREDMFAGQFEWGPSRGDNFDMTHPLFRWVAMLNNFRRLYPALQTGAQTILASDAAGPGLFAYTRRLEKQEIIVVINTAITSRTLLNCPTKYPPGTIMANLLNPKELATVTPGFRISSVTVSPSSVKIFIAQAQMLPLDPTVVGISPTHDFRNAPAGTSIEIHFSGPMDTESVETAFSTTPQVQGAISWSPTHDAMVFTPSAPGFPSRAMIDVHIASTAKSAVSGKYLHGCFDSRFLTN